MIASSSSLIPLLAALGYNQQFNESMIAYMKSLGYTKSFNESLYDYLASLGYSGDLNNKLYLWSLAGYALTGGLAINTYPKFTTSLLVVGATISTAYVAGSYTWVSGAVTEASVAYYVDGGLVASNYVLAAGDVLIEATVSITATGLPGGTTVQAIPNSVQNTAPHAIASATQTISVVPGDGSGDAFAPDAMGAPTLASTATRITVTLASDPADNNSPITDRQARYSLDAGGTWSTPASIVSGGVITGMVPGTTGILVQTRAINSIDPDPNNWSTSASINTKIVTLVGHKTYGVPTSAGDKVVSLTDLTGGIASAPAADDLVELFMASGSVSNRAIGETTGTYTTYMAKLYVNLTEDLNFYAAYKVMGSTPDTQLTVTNTQNGGDAAAVLIKVWRYVDPVNPIDVAVVVTSGNNGQPVPGAITPAQPNAVISVVGAGAAGNAVAADFTSSDLSDFISLLRNNTHSVSIAGGRKDWTAGAFTAAQFGGGNNAAGNARAAIAIAHRGI